MKITTEICKGVLSVDLEGEFDMHAVDLFKETVDSGLNGSGIKDLMIKMHEVPFIDSSGIGALLGRYKKIAHAGGKIALTGVQVPVKKILELSGILDIMKLYDDENEALAHF